MTSLQFLNSPEEKTRVAAAAASDLFSRLSSSTKYETKTAKTSNIANFRSFTGYSISALQGSMFSSAVYIHVNC